jgi:hypothetical protein
MYPYAPPETILRHLAEQAERDRRSPHASTRSRGHQDDGRASDVRDRRWHRGQK